MEPLILIVYTADTSGLVIYGTASWVTLSKKWITYEINAHFLKALQCLFKLKLGDFFSFIFSDFSLFS